MACLTCGDTGWVCEAHEDKPWGGVSDHPNACNCGAPGEPCKKCNPSDADNPPDMSRAGIKTVFDKDGYRH